MKPLANPRLPPTSRRLPDPASMKDLIEYVARSLVEHPDEVVVSERSSGYRVVYHLTVHEDDMGRVIGKQGRIAQAMRTLLKVAATRSGQRVSLEIGD